MQLNLNNLFHWRPATYQQVVIKKNYSTPLLLLEFNIQLKMPFFVSNYRQTNKVQKKLFKNAKKRKYFNITFPHTASEKKNTFFLIFSLLFYLNPFFFNMHDTLF